MPTTYRPYEPNQTLLLPPSVSEWLPEDHLAHFINDAVDALDLRAFHARYQGDGRRNMPFDPAMLVNEGVNGQVMRQLVRPNRIGDFFGDVITASRFEAILKGRGKKPFMEYAECPKPLHGARATTAAESSVF